MAATSGVSRWRLRVSARWYMAHTSMSHGLSNAPAAWLWRAIWSRAWRQMNRKSLSKRPRAERTAPSVGRRSPKAGASGLCFGQGGGGVEPVDVGEEAVFCLHHLLVVEGGAFAVGLVESGEPVVDLIGDVVVDVVGPGALAGQISPGDQRSGVDAVGGRQSPPGISRDLSEVGFGVISAHGQVGDIGGGGPAVAAGEHRVDDLFGLGVGRRGLGVGRGLVADDVEPILGAAPRQADVELVAPGGCADERQRGIHGGALRSGLGDGVAQIEVLGGIRGR